VLQAREDEFLGMDDVFFATFVHNSSNEICFSIMSVSTTLEWSGALFIQQSLGVGAGHWFVYSSELWASLDCAYINSSEKVDDSCS
jgi:hypothetical protein